MSPKSDSWGYGKPYWQKVRKKLNFVDELMDFTP